MVTTPDLVERVDGRGRHGRDAAVARRRVDHVARLAALDHGGYEGLDAVDDPPYVHGQGPAPVVQLVIPQVAFGSPAHPGVVAQHVDGPEPLVGLIAQRHHRVEVGDVGLHPDHVEAVGGQVSHGGVEHRCLHVGQHHPHAFGREAGAHGSAHAAGAAGDHGHPTREVLHQRLSLMSSPSLRSRGGQVVVALVHERDHVGRGHPGHDLAALDAALLAHGQARRHGAPAGRPPDRRASRAGGCPPPPLPAGGWCRCAGSRPAKRPDRGRGRRGRAGT